jgi:hypothetical protein
MQQNHVKPSLLLRQLWLLAAVAGIFAARYFWPSLVCLVLVVIHQHRRIFKAETQFSLLFMTGLLLFYVLGAAYSILRHEAPQPCLAAA